MISLQKYAGSRQQSYSVTKMSMFATLATAKLDTESTEGSNFVVVRHTIDQLPILWLYPWTVYEHLAQSAV
jgi:hypothetical protein